MPFVSQLFFQPSSPRHACNSAPSPLPLSFTSSFKNELCTVNNFPQMEIPPTLLLSVTTVSSGINKKSKYDQIIPIGQANNFYSETFSTQQVTVRFRTPNSGENAGNLNINEVKSLLFSSPHLSWNGEQDVALITRIIRHANLQLFASCSSPSLTQQYTRFIYRCTQRSMHCL